MPAKQFYKDHWTTIGQERLDRYRDIEIQVITQPDMAGRLLPMIKNMAGYARDNEDISNEEIDVILSTLDQALAEKTYLVLAPQFVVTGLR